jgi:hypothetical protein
MTLKLALILGLIAFGIWWIAQEMAEVNRN